MKILILIGLYTSLSLAYSKVQLEALNQWDMQYLEKKILIQKLKREDYVQKLKQAKIFIINGNLKKAKRILLNMPDETSKLELIKKYYLSILYFIQADYVESLKWLTDGQFDNDEFFSKICALKITTMIVLSKSSKQLQADFDRCAIINRRYSKTEHLWFDVLVGLRDPQRVSRLLDLLSSPSYFAQSMENLEQGKLWLKLMIYLNQEKVVYPYLASIPTEFYLDNEIRELMSLIYYRLGHYALSADLIEDLSTPNAENIKGNIFLDRDKYEIAYGHFKLALKAKSTSRNAIERLIPLSWILGQFTEGGIFLKKLQADQTNAKRKEILEAVFLIRQEKYDQAERLLLNLRNKLKNFQPLEISQLLSYIYLRKNDREGLLKHATFACNQFDGMNCWTLFQWQTWEDISLTINRKGRVLPKDELNLDKLKSKVDSKPLEEAIFIDQNDIEELDSAMVQLKP